MFVSVFAAAVEPVGDVVEAAEQRGKIMEDVRPPVQMVEIEPRRAKVDDDWFVLLDAAARVPGILLFGCVALL